MKSGTVLLLGRPNVGKSTFLNNLIGQKVAITSPKPQTTRVPLYATFTNEQGTLHFIDTPGIFGRAEDNLSKQINETTLREIEKEVDVILYMVDHTRRRDFEEGKVLGLVRKINAKKKFLVINKIDLQEKTYVVQYKFLQDEVDDVFSISALERKHFRPLIDAIFDSLDENSADNDDPYYREVTPERPSPLENMTSKGFVGELIREKIFLHTGKEVPYTATVIVDDILDRPNGDLYIKAQIITVHDRYKKMLIGKKGEKIRDLGRLARKEIELAINRHVYLDLTVETDPHWQEKYF